MRARAKYIIVSAAIGLMLGQTGCSLGAGGARFLSFVGLTQKPVIVALVPQPGVLNPFASHEELRKTMSASLKRPVLLDLCLPIQLSPNLDLGFYDFAIASEECYASIPGRERFGVVAVARDQNGQAARPAVLIVATDSAIDDVSGLRDKRVAFGPLLDGRTHLAALLLLSDHGLRKSDLKLELLPVPGSLRHFSSMTGIARSVVQGDSDAGFMDEAAYDELPPSADGNQPARDKLRVIARTMPIADTLVIRSPKAEPEVVQQVAAFLLDAETKCPGALRPLRVSGYEAPDAQLTERCRRLASAAEATPPAPSADDSE